MSGHCIGATFPDFISERWIGSKVIRKHKIIFILNGFYFYSNLLPRR